MAMRAGKLLDMLRVEGVVFLASPVVSPTPGVGSLQRLYIERLSKRIWKTKFKKTVVSQGPHRKTKKLKLV
jgi:hypothetical protein